jgi:hypothetical protein
MDVVVLTGFVKDVKESRTVVTGRDKELRLGDHGYMTLDQTLL